MTEENMIWVHVGQLVSDRRDQLMKECIEHQRQISNKKRWFSNKIRAISSLISSSNLNGGHVLKRGPWYGCICTWELSDPHTQGYRCLSISSSHSSSEGKGGRKQTHTTKVKDNSIYCVTS